MIAAAEKLNPYRRAGGRWGGVLCVAHGVVMILAEQTLKPFPIHRPWIAAQPTPLQDARFTPALQERHQQIPNVVREIALEELWR
jgi:hypothetical protein